MGDDVERQGEPSGEWDEAATPFGQMPNINGNLVSPNFREGPRREPDAHPLRRFVLGLVPLVVVVLVLLLVAHQL
jgi:hypothetical protein